MIYLVNLINGHIYNTARLAQLHRVCLILDISVIPPVALDINNNWFAGLFDSDGTITFSLKNEVPQLSMRVVGKLLINIEAFTLLGGAIYFDRSQYGSYVWSIQSRKDILYFLSYFNDNIFKSNKSKRIHLIKEYYRLCDLKAYKSTSDHHKSWVIFLSKWHFLS